MFRKNLFITSLLLILLFSITCKNTNEVLVEYKNGDKQETIQRKDLQFIIKLNQFQKKEDLSVAIQTQILEELAFLSVGNLAFHSLPENTKKEFEKDIQRNFIFLNEKAFLNAMNLISQEKISNLIYKYIQMQLLFLRKDEKVNRNEEAKLILKQLNDTTKEEEIEKIIFEKNENPRYKILGGLVDPLCLNCGQNPVPQLTDELLKEENKNNKFILVEDNAGYWIIRNLGVKEIKEKDLSSMYEDYHKKSQFSARKFLNNPNYTKEYQENELKTIKEQILMDEKQIEQFSKDQANQQSNMLKRNSLNHHIQELQKKYNFKLNEETTKKIDNISVKDWDEDLELFIFENQSYKIKDFFNEIRKYQIEPQALSINEVAPLLNQVYVPYIVLQKSPYTKDIKEYSETFKNLITKQIYTNYYIQYEFKDLNVSEEEIQKYYELRKNNEFTVQNNGKSRTLSLNEVKDRIKQALLTEKRQKQILQVKENLFKNYDVKIHKERLKEGKV